MSGNLLMEAIGNISDKYVMKYSDMASIRKYFIRKKFITYVGVCATFVLLVLSVAILKMNTKSRDSDKPPCFFWNGYLYSNDFGHAEGIMEEVAEGYYYVGIVKDIGEKLPQNDLEGNVNGTLYLDSNEEVAYLKSVNGEEIAYMRYVRKE